MKAKREFLIVSVIVALGLFFVFSTNMAQAKTIELSYCNFFPPTHIQGKLGQSWAEEIEKRTNGKVKFNYYPGGALLKGPKMYDGILKGITDIGMSVFAYSRGVFPAMEAFDLPHGYLSGRSATLIANDFYKKFKPKELNKVKVCYLHGHGPGLLFSKKAVYKMEDLNGLKVRSVGAAAKACKYLGAVPVSMPQSGTYEALQKGVVDATFSPIEVLKGWKQGEVVKYVIECYSVGYSTCLYVLMNLDKWNSLPKDVQKVFNEVNAEWIAKHAEAWDTSDEEGRKFSDSLGNKVIPLSKQEGDRWAEAVQPVINDYIKAAEEKGLPGKDYVNFIKELIKKYSK